MFQAAIHINFADGERQQRGLKNVENMLQAVDQFTIEVVCHGDGIELVVDGRSRHAAEVERLCRAGVRFVACENTMRDRSIDKNGLLPGVDTVPSGAGEIIQKQQDGFGYFKP